MDLAVRAVKSDEKRRPEYMMLYIRDNEMRAEGREEGIITSIRNLLETLKLTAQQAMDALKISAEDQQRYLKML